MNVGKLNVALTNRRVMPLLGSLPDLYIQRDVMGVVVDLQRSVYR